MVVGDATTRRVEAVHAHPGVAEVDDDHLSEAIDLTRTDQLVRYGLGLRDQLDLTFGAGPLGRDFPGMLIGSVGDADGADAVAALSRLGEHQIDAGIDPSCPGQSIGGVDVDHPAQSIDTTTLVGRQQNAVDHSTACGQAQRGVHCSLPNC